MSSEIRLDEPIAPTQDILNGPSFQQNFNSHDNTNRLNKLTAKVYFLYPLYFLYAAAVGITFAPQLEMRTKIVCESYNLPIGQSCDDIPTFRNDIANLTTVITLITGILACLTTSYLSAFSDKVGRLPILTVSSAGYFLTHAINSWVSTRLNPNELYLLYISAAIEGITGSQSTVMAVAHAYASDCTDNGSRAHVFSKLMGILFTGVAIGPALATGLTKSTGDFKNSFIAASILSLIMLIFSFIIPESLVFHKLDIEENERRINKMPSIVENLKKPFTTLAPKDDNNKRNYNLLAISISYIFVVLAIGSVQIKFLYAKFKFNWDVTQVGNFIAFVGTVRAICLLIIIPFALKTLKEFKFKTELPQSPPLRTMYEDEDEETIDGDLIIKAINQSEIKFDLILLKSCLAIDSLAYLGLAISSNVTQFAIFTSLSALGGGVSPSAISSLALLLAPQSKSNQQGTVLGSFSSIQSLGSQILGPLFYGLIYSLSPNGLFLIIIGLSFIISIISSMFVRF